MCGEINNHDKLLRVYVDHGEAYGNLGDEAMLLNAFDRLTRYLGPCHFILPKEDERPLPVGLSQVEFILPPRLIFLRRVEVLRRWFNKLNRIPGAWKWLRKPNNLFFWRLATWWIKLEATLTTLGLRRSTMAGLDPFRNLLSTCDVFYGVGAAGLNDCSPGVLLYKAWLYSEARRFVKVSALSSQGLGPFQTRWAKPLLCKAFSKLDLLSFRDFRNSYDWVHVDSPKGVRYKVTGDEAFTLIPSEPDRIAAYLVSVGLPKQESFIAIHFRATDYTQDTQSFLPRIAEILDGLLRQISHHLVFFPMSYDLHSGDDELYGRRIRELMCEKERMHIAPASRDVRLVKGAIGRARYSLGLSYHVHVFSLSQGHPALVLYTGEYYRYKSEGLIDYYGRPSVALDMNNATIASIIAACKAIENDYASVCHAIERVNQQILMDNDWVLKEMASMLNRTVPVSLAIGK